MHSLIAAFPLTIGHSIRYRFPGADGWFGKGRALVLNVRWTSDLLKHSPGDKRDHPKEISDQHPEHNEESNRRQHTGRTRTLGE
jgi:hypothetical protein